MGSEWERCRHWIEAAIDQSPGLQGIEDVERLIGAGVYQLWCGSLCAIITEIVQFQQAKVLMIRIAGGDLEELVKTEPLFCEYARSKGCTRIMGEGRRGWERVFKPIGYRFAYVTLEKDLI